MLGLFKDPIEVWRLDIDCGIGRLVKIGTIIVDLGIDTAFELLLMLN